MRPHQLQFGGIGTYPNNTEIDFDALSTLGLYLIVGPTGAGKSTIFDALTYALFGKVAGDRPEGTIVSDHANRITPFINLEFSHRNVRYCVKRKPSVDNKSPKPGDQVFIEFKSDGTEENRITGAKNVTDAVEALIGLDAKQFMRVILLPQNEFRQFLLANSNEKVTLLRALFGTTMYETIALKLDNSAKDYNIAAKDAELAIEFQRETAINAMTALREKDLIPKIPEEFNIDAFLELVRPLAEAATHDAAVALKAFETAVQEQENAKSEAERFDAAQERDELMTANSTDQPAVDEATTKVDNHQRAVALSPHIKRSQELAEEISRATQSVTDARTALLQHSAHGATDFSGKMQAVAQSGTAQSFRDVISEVNQQIADFEKTLNRIAQLQKTVQDQSKTYAYAETQLEALKSQHDELATNATALVAAMTSAQQAQLQLPELRNAVNELDDKIVRGDVQAAQSNLAEVTQAYNGVRDAFNTAATALAVALTERTKHLAGELAAELQQDQECPVCGSTTHPSKATPSADVDPTKLQASRDKAQGELVRQEALLQQAQQEVEHAQAVAATLPSAQEQVNLRQLLSETEALVSSYEAAQAAVTKNQKDVDFVDAKVKEATIQRDTAAGLRDNAHKELHEGVELPLGVTAESIAAEKALIETALSLTQQLDTHERTLADALAGARQADDTVQSMLTASSFTSTDEALALVLPESQLHTYGKVLRVYQERSDQLKKLAGKIGSNPIPASRPDVEALEIAARTQRELNVVAAEKKTQLNSKYDDLQSVKTALAEVGPEAERVRELAREAQRMANVIRMGQGDHLSLEKWVQRTLFEEVCEVATQQISTLSSGRYRLTLNSDGQKTGNRSAGLDIFVIDSHTGKSRAVQTLSGGEQFLTSLALALALAEVVQRHSGGIEMSSLFIDEGFGSLDADNLEIAVDVLRSLQDSGRTVGVISHVESMQQELSVGIRVTRSPGGSSLEVMAQKAQ